VNGKIIAHVEHLREEIRQVYNLAADQEVGHSLVLCLQEREQVSRALARV
jgi:hypothetical protein